MGPEQQSPPEMYITSANHIVIQARLADLDKKLMT